MQGLYLGAEIVAVLVLLLVLALVLLSLRRAWLSRQGGTFECALRLGDARPGVGWALGVARYNSERLEWFRYFSFSTRPRKTFYRSELSVMDDREPDPVEAGSLYAGQRIVHMQTVTKDGEETLELAMSGESLTGMLSWLEAAPPGVMGY